MKLKEKNQLEQKEIHSYEVHASDLGLVVVVMVMFRVCVCVRLCQNGYIHVHPSTGIYVRVRAFACMRVHVTVCFTPTIRAEYTVIYSKFVSFTRCHCTCCCAHGKYIKYHIFR